MNDNRYDIDDDMYMKLMDAVETGNIDDINKYYDSVLIIREDGVAIGLSDEYEFFYTAIENNQLQSLKVLYSKSVNKEEDLSLCLYTLLTEFRDKNELIKFTMTELFGPDIFTNSQKYHKAIEKYSYDFSDSDKFTQCVLDYIQKILKRFIKKEMYKGPINDQTELDCGICLTEMNAENQEIIQCKTCKKCVHNECNEKWNETCVYCRN